MGATRHHATRRLLIVSHSREVGGAEVYLENLIGHLARQSSRRWAPELICRRDEDVSAWAAAIEELAPVTRLDVGRPADVVEMGRRMRAATLVHLNLSYPAGKYPLAVGAMARNLRRPMLVTHHLGLKVGPPWRQFMRWLGRAARRHIAVSSHTRRVLVTDYAYPADNVRVVHNGIDPNLFQPSSADARRRMRHAAGDMLEGRPWGDDVFLACTVARLSSQKGLFELVDAAATVIEQTPNARFVVLGEGDRRRELSDHIRQRGLEQRFFLPGALPRPLVAEWLGAGDLFALPSRYEGGPATALMEAMASGCAVVATDVSGVDELITDPGLGLLVPPRDPGALAASILQLMSNADLRAEMGQRARAKVLSEFTIDACMRRTDVILDEAAEGGRGGARRSSAAGNSV